MQSSVRFRFTWKSDYTGIMVQTVHNFLINFTYSVNRGKYIIYLLIFVFKYNNLFQITGLENLSELKVLNLAGNMIRKISNLSGLTSLEELNIRRNRIRSTAGLEAVPTIEKLYMSNNELQVMRYLLKNANIELSFL